MEPLIVLVTVTGAAEVIARRRGHPDPEGVALRAGVCAMFLLTGTVHFIGKREELIAMVPGQLPWPGAVVTVTGVLELLGALGLLDRRLAPWAARGLGILLVAMFPANVHLALTGDDLPWWDHLVPRTLMQGAFLAAVAGIALPALRGRPRRPRRPRRRVADPDPGPLGPTIQ
ncbi:DoxX family protein [Brachybacterium halotolerans subsp. kimchii]|uniref:DoxX family protein n=1 Tax=Brachybacterium halotolerans TaxID=2795215 RepID=UPI001E49D043|nr:DoxX family protein [Brachybacterium halotolerans]UEJ81430.1 DoxX family protein [Brachybacterium halotolerans subsp. kimchii]